MILTEFYMPIFEYRCKKCGAVFEELVSGDRNKEINCQICGHTDTEKLMSVIGGISMGRNSGPSCGSQCSQTSSCCSGGVCPHAG
jgi:putative FmdB family regulatory protein